MILHYLSLIESYKSICTIRDDIRWVSINVFFDWHFGDLLGKVY